MYSSFVLERDDSATLQCHSWMPNMKSESLVVLVHGIGEHAKRYDPVAERLNQSGIAVYSFDLRGHGRSSGKRGHIGSFTTTHGDMDALACRAREAVGDLPLFFFGHSLGGGIVLSKWQREPESAKAFIATSPWLELVERKPPALIAASRVLKALLPSLTIPTGLDADLLSSDEEVTSAYRKDPLVHGKISVATAIDAIDSAAKVLEVEHPGAPLLLAHGSFDGICSAEASRRLASKSPDSITYLEYPARHEIFNEPGLFDSLTDSISGFIGQIAGR